MSQRVVLDNLALFLEYMLTERLAELDQEKKKFSAKFARISKEQEILKTELNNLIKEITSHGFCFGFALTHGAMDHIGKLEWWEDVLVRIATWDKKRDSLDAEIKRPNQAAESVSAGSNEESESKKPLALKDYFERALNYIVVTHAAVPGPFQLVGVSQVNIVHPAGHVLDVPASKTDSKKKPATQIKRSYFEIVDNEAKNSHQPFKTIKSGSLVVGHLTKAQLMSDLDESMFKNSIILAHRLEHTLHITCHGSTWMVYDPNYDHTDAKRIHKVGSKSECIDEVFCLLGPSIAIELAFFDENVRVDFPEYNKLAVDSPHVLLEGYGLRLLAKRSPQMLDVVMQNIAKNKKQKDAADKVARDLTVQGGNGCSGLQMVSVYAPTILPEVLKLAAESKDGPDHIARALMLQEKKKEGRTGLQTMAQHAPRALIETVKVAAKSRKGADMVSQALALQEKKSGESGLHVVACHAPDALPDLLMLAAESKAGAHEIMRACSIENRDGYTGNNIVEKFAKGHQDKLISAFAASLKQLELNALAVLQKDIQNAATDASSPYRGLCKTLTPSFVFFGSKYTKTTLWKGFVGALRTEILERNGSYPKVTNRAMLA